MWSPLMKVPGPLRWVSCQRYIFGVSLENYQISRLIRKFQREAAGNALEALPFWTRDLLALQPWSWTLWRHFGRENFEIRPRACLSKTLHQTFSLISRDAVSTKPLNNMAQASSHVSREVRDVCTRANVGWGKVQIPCIKWLQGKNGKFE